MKRKLSLSVSTAAALLLAVLLIGGGIGYLLHAARQPTCTPTAPMDGTHFYATVVKVYDTSVHVKGIPENDINHRGEFTVSLDASAGDRAVLDEANAPLALADLHAGDMVYVTYNGPVQETYPAGIRNATLIRVKK